VDVGSDKMFDRMLTRQNGFQQNRIRRWRGDIQGTLRCDVELERCTLPYDRVNTERGTWDGVWMNERPPQGSLSTFGEEGSLCFTGRRGGVRFVKRRAIHVSHEAWIFLSGHAFVLRDNHDTYLLGVFMFDWRLFRGIIWKKENCTPCSGGGGIVGERSLAKWWIRLVSFHFFEPDTRLADWQNGTIWKSFDASSLTDGGCHGCRGSTHRKGKWIVGSRDKQGRDCLVILFAWCLVGVVERNASGVKSWRDPKPKTVLSPYDSSKYFINNRGLGSGWSHTKDSTTRTHMKIKTMCVCVCVCVCSTCFLRYHFWNFLCLFFVVLF